MVGEIPEFYVILVEPKYGGNIGAIARLMDNFSFKNLILVSPCEFDDECYARAMHAQKTLDKAKIVSSYNDAIKNLDFLVATSSIESQNDKRHLRNAVLLKELSKKFTEINGKIGLIFGREDYGLYNEEIAKCDIMLKIPTSEAYSSLNLSHAVAIVLYTLYIQDIQEKGESVEKRIIGNVEKEKLYNFLSQLLEEINYPDHKKENTELMFKRIMGRAIPSKWEYHTLMGVLSKSLEKIKDKK
jgi:TrmH family RNA methyltransferase